MLGFDAVGRLALGEVPSATATTPAFSKFSDGTRKAGLAAAVIATTFVGFVPPPPAQAAKVFTKFSEPQRKAIQQALWRFQPPAPKAATAIFTKFSQPQPPKIMLPDEQPSPLFEVFPPQPPPFTGFATFSQPLRVKANVTLLAVQFTYTPTFTPPDTHDLVFMGDQFRKKKRRDLIDEEVSRKARLRSDLEQAIYGPEVVYSPPPAALPEAPPAPPNIEELARAVMQARLAQEQAQRAAIEQDDEDVIEMILRDL